MREKKEKKTDTVVEGTAMPSEKTDIVSLRDVIESEAFTHSPSPLKVALGKDGEGNYAVCRLEKMPHLLIAGMREGDVTTYLHAVIVSLLYTTSAEDVRLILVDSAQGAFRAYDGVPHLLDGKILCNASQALDVLSWLLEEVERRHGLFAPYGARDLREFNGSDAVKNGMEQKLPYIVVVLNELADLMLDRTFRKTAEDKITRIAQKARAAGIHLVFATAQPTVDVITGMLKASFPGRIAFAVKRTLDSRVILDEDGAETLFGQNEMLYAPYGADEPIRMQSVFVTKEDISAVVETVRRHGGQEES